MKTLSDLTTLTAQSLKALIKVAVKSRCQPNRAAQRNQPLVILGNGPSLNETLASHTEYLRHAVTMAVNFAANTPMFKKLKPKYYILADPHFFNSTDDPNVIRLAESLMAVDWPMTLLLPFSAGKNSIITPTRYLTIQKYNAVGIEGFRWLTDFLMSHRLAMPRPRNVLIPAIINGIWLGYDEIYITGADHSWTKTLDVDDENRVVSIQPHFYKEDSQETARIKAEYLNYPLHSILESLTTAFRSYWIIEDYARRHGIKIYNATHGSFIDAFPRKPLP